MKKTERTVEKSEDFIRRVMEKNFHQKLDSETLRNAAERLIEALPPAKPAKEAA